jgi:peptidoglycan biosynthesis protein MviN/MurJ (putative lipid II flippase)
MATFLKTFIVVLLVVLLAHAFVGWLRPDVTQGFSFLPGDIKYENPGGNVRVYFPIVTSIVLSVVLTLILNLFGRFFGR